MLLARSKGFDKTGLGRRLCPQWETFHTTHTQLHCKHVVLKASEVAFMINDKQRSKWEHCWTRCLYKTDISAEWIGAAEDRGAELPGVFWQMLLSKMIYKQMAKIRENIKICAEWKKKGFSFFGRLQILVVLLKLQKGLVFKFRRSFSFTNTHPHTQS